MKSPLVEISVALFLIVANFFLWRSIVEPNDLRIEMLAVGKGTALLIIAPSGKTLLYNAGSDTSILRSLGEALPYGDKKIDVVVEGDPASARAGGLSSVFARYKVGAFITAGAEESAALAASAAGTKTITAMRGDRINLGDDTYADVLFPDRDVSKGSSADAVVVLALHYASSTILLDDAPPAVERWIQKESGPFGADLIISTSTPPGVYTFR